MNNDLALVSLLHFLPDLPRCVLLAAGFRGGDGVRIFKANLPPKVIIMSSTQKQVCDELRRRICAKLQTGTAPETGWVNQGITRR
jgi:hypothetical protein